MNRLYFIIIFIFGAFQSAIFAQNPTLDKLKSNSDSAQARILSGNNSNYSPSIFVNPFIGTGGHGHTFPGATAPFGMIQLSPDTRYDGWDGCSGYHYSDSIIYGFSHTHLSGTGVPDYCDLLVVPQSKKAKTIPGYLSKNGYGSSFSHDSEKASPGYYEVILKDPNIKVRLSTTDRAVIHEYTFQNKKRKTIYFTHIYNSAYFISIYLSLLSLSLLLLLSSLLSLLSLDLFLDLLLDLLLEELRFFSLTNSTTVR